MSYLSWWNVVKESFLSLSLNKLKIIPVREVKQRKGSPRPNDMMTKGMATIALFEGEVLPTP
jgi:hypothetical protein